MRIGLMVGPERARYPTKIARMQSDAAWADAAGLDSVWVPQIPDEFDAMTAVVLMATTTSRVELGTAVVPVQTRHPIALVQQALSTQMACAGRFALGLGPSHHWIVESMLGLSYERPAAQVDALLDVLDAAFVGPGMVDVENEFHRIHNNVDITDQAPPAVLLAALGPVMLRIAGERTDGTILWLADERAIGDFIAPRINQAASNARRPAPRIVAGVPVCLCRPSDTERARSRAARVLSEAEISPNYQRLLDRGDATGVADILAAGDESAIRARFEAFASAGVTDLSLRVVPIGDDRDELLASMARTRELIAHIATEH